MLILLGYGDDEAQVCRDQTLLGFLAFRTALTDCLCQLYLLLNCYKGLTTNLNEVLIQCFTRSVGNALLNL